MAPQVRHKCTEKMHDVAQIHKMFRCEWRPKGNLDGMKNDKYQRLESYGALGGPRMSFSVDPRCAH